MSNLLLTRRVSVMFFAVACAALLCSCATILKGDYETVSISSNPPGAQVTFDGNSRVGQTPVILPIVDSRISHTIVLQLEGYADANIVLGNHLGIGWLLLDIFLTGLVGVIVDGVTGDWMELDANQLHVEMQPIR